MSGLRAFWASTIGKKVVMAVTGLLLVMLGLLLALPIPFTNYVFGVLMLLFVFSLLERDGVVEVLQHLRVEFDLAMALAGCTSVAELTPDLVVDA